MQSACLKGANNRLMRRSKRHLLVGPREQYRRKVDPRVPSKS